MANIEDKVISAVLADKQIHVLLQANIDSLLRTHSDIWLFIKDYYESNQSLPPINIVKENFSFPLVFLGIKILSGTT